MSSEYSMIALYAPWLSKKWALVDWPPLEYKEVVREKFEGLNAIWCRVIIAQIIVLFLEAKYFLLAYKT